MSDKFGNEISLCMTHGYGHNGISWRKYELAKAIGVSLTTLRSYVDGKTFPNPAQRDKMFRAFFPSKAKQETKEARRFQRAWKNEFDKREQAKATAASVKVAKFSLRNVWAHVLKTNSDGFDTLVNGSSSKSKFGGFAPEQIEITKNNRRFFVAYPDELKHAVESGEVHYDLHADEPEYLGFELNEFARHFPDGFLEESIDRHSKAYSQIVLKDAKGDSRNKLYNKLKFGVYSVSSRKTTGEEEADIAEISVYVTDYFTKWIMSRVYEDVRQQGAGFLRSFQMYPSFESDRGAIHLPILAPSLGLNCAIIAKAAGNENRMVFAETMKTSSNFLQHNKIHIPVNEGMNLEDLIPNTDTVVLHRLYKRMLEEEVGVGFFEHCEYETLDIFVDKRVGEVAILGVIETDLTIGEINEIRKTAKDKKREYGGKELIDVPATEAEIIEFCLDQPTSINGFVSYTPHMLDLLFKRGVFDKLDF